MIRLLKKLVTQFVDHSHIFSTLRPRKMGEILPYLLLEFMVPSFHVEGTKNYRPTYG